MNIGTNYQRLVVNPVPFDAKRANWYVASNQIVIESVAEYLIRIPLDIRDGSPVAMYIPKDGYTSLGNYPIEDLDATLINYDTYLYAFIEGVQDADFVPIFKLGDEYLLQQAIEDTEGITGFVDKDNIDVSYNWTNRTITLTGDLRYYWRGRLKELTSPWVSPVHADVVDVYFLYSSDGDTFSWSQTPWEFSDCMVSFANYKSTAAMSFVICETHGVMDKDAHEGQHYTQGTYLDPVNGGGKATAGTYILDTATDVANSPGFDQALLRDEDKATVVPAWIQGTYTTMYIGASLVAMFDVAATLPFKSTGSYIQVNNPLTGALSDGINNRFYNVYQVLIPATSDSDSQKFRMIMLQPQATYTSQALAEAEDPNGLIFGEFSNLTPEFKVYTRLTYGTSAGDSNTGKCRLKSITYVAGTKANSFNIGGFTPTDHAALSNLIWGSSGHTGTANTIAGFGASGEAVYIDPTTITGWNETPQELIGLTPSFNPANGINAYMTMGGNTTITFSALIPGQGGFINVQNVTSVYSITLSGSYTFKISESLFYTGDIIDMSGNGNLDQLWWDYDGIRVVINGQYDIGS